MNRWTATQTDRHRCTHDDNTPWARGNKTKFAKQLQPTNMRKPVGASD